MLSRAKGVRSAIKEAGIVAVEVVEWSSDQYVVVPWHVISDEASLTTSYRTFRSMNRAGYDQTYLQKAIFFCGQQIATGPYNAARKVIDVSGDGEDNYGDGDRASLNLQPAVLAQGVTINGLPIKPGSAKSPRDPMTTGSQVPYDTDRTVTAYYQSHVIGGPGAFLEPANGYDDFARAILKKLILEISQNDTHLLPYAS